jgi:hypothetical protein
MVSFGTLGLANDDAVGHGQAKDAAIDAKRRFDRFDLTSVRGSDYESTHKESA